MKNELTIEEIVDDTIVIYNGVKNVGINIGEMFTIDDTNLTREYTRQAALYAYFSGILARLDREYSAAENAREQEYAATDLGVREALLMSDQKTTETAIKSSIILDAVYQAKVASAIEAKYDVNILKAIVKALEMRADMLVSIGAHLRHEMDMTGLNIRQAEFDKSLNDAKRTMKTRKASYSK